MGAFRRCRACIVNAACWADEWAVGVKVWDAGWGWSGQTLRTSAPGVHDLWAVMWGRYFRGGGGWAPCA
jgi:hypothetical protein